MWMICEFTDYTQKGKTSVTAKELTIGVASVYRY